MKIELEKGVWLADGEGDPPRTVLKDHAKEFITMEDAIRAVIEARKYGLFACAQIVSSGLLEKEKSKPQ